jgi:hypothetical protein
MNFNVYSDSCITTQNITLGNVFLDDTFVMAYRCYTIHHLHSQVPQPSPPQPGSIARMVTIDLDISARGKNRSQCCIGEEFVGVAHQHQAIR